MARKLQRRDQRTGATASREREPGHKRAPSRRKRNEPTSPPAKEERKGLALIAEVLDWIKDIKTYRQGRRVVLPSRVEKNLPNVLSAKRSIILSTTSLSAAEVCPRSSAMSHASFEDQQAITSDRSRGRSKSHG